MYPTRRLLSRAWTSLYLLTEKIGIIFCFKINYIKLLVVPLFWLVTLSNIYIKRLHVKYRRRANSSDFRESRRSRFAVIPAINHQGAPWYTRLKVAGERGRETVAGRGQPTFRTTAPFFCAIRYNCQGLVTFASFRSEVSDVYVALCWFSCVEAASSKRPVGRGEGDGQWAEDEGAETRWTMQTVVAIANLPLVSANCFERDADAQDNVTCFSLILFR